MTEIVPDADGYFYIGAHRFRSAPEAAFVETESEAREWIEAHRKPTK